MGMGDLHCTGHTPKGEIQTAEREGTTKKGPIHSRLEWGKLGWGKG